MLWYPFLNDEEYIVIETPDFIKSGEVARLIPVISDSRKEQRAASALLAIFSAVPDFANSILASLGQKIGKRSIVNTFTEVVFHEETSDRPDGLIIIQTGKSNWTTLIEAKIGKAKLEKDQIERYLRLAKNHSIDAVISISNEFVARPTHHPISVSKILTNKVDLFHLSWTSILTEAILLHENSELSDPEQAFLIREFVRFFSHDSAGVTGYTQMPPTWNEAVKTLQSGGKLKTNSLEVEQIVSGWHQETREISLQLSQYLTRRVELKLSKKHANDASARIREDAQLLCDKGVLLSSFSIPDTVSDLFLAADLKTRSIRASMLVDAPKDKKTTKARINWLLRQLKDADEVDVTVRIKWSSRATDTDVPLARLRESSDLPEILSSNATPRAFEVMSTSSQGGRFSGNKTFIMDVEELCPYFYENVGQRLKNPPQPAPPKPHFPTENIVGAPEEKILPRHGNDHTGLIEIPSFLQRLNTEGIHRPPSAQLGGRKPISHRVSRFSPEYITGKRPL
jgi:hypothetical protein